MVNQKIMYAYIKSLFVNAKPNNIINYINSTRLVYEESKKNNYKLIDNIIALKFYSTFESKCIIYLIYVLLEIKLECKCNFFCTCKLNEYDFQKEYPEFDYLMEDTIEYNKLKLFAFITKILINYIPAKNNKGLLLVLITLISEGPNTNYITGSGQTVITSRRVYIYEKEGFNEVDSKLFNNIFKNSPVINDISIINNINFITYKNKKMSYKIKSVNNISDCNQKIYNFNRKKKSYKKSRKVKLTNSTNSTSKKLDQKTDPIIESSSFFEEKQIEFTDQIVEPTIEKIDDNVDNLFLGDWILDLEY